jgi:hypothetical protein
LAKTDSNHHDDIIIPLDLAGFVVHFIYRLPTKGQIMSLQQYCLTQEDTPWNLATLFDQVADVFYKQVIVTESYNANSMEFSPYDPPDIYEFRKARKPAILTFCPKMIMKLQIVQTLSTNKVPYYSKKALPSSIDYERRSPYFAFRPHDVIQNTLRQTTQ